MAPMLDNVREALADAASRAERLPTRRREQTWFFRVQRTARRPTIAHSLWRDPVEWPPATSYHWQSSVKPIASEPATLTVTMPRFPRHRRPSVSLRCGNIG